jgi:hypothetical protein
VTRLFKYAMRAGRDHFAPYLDTLTGLFVTAFNETKSSSFVYAGSICVGVFATDPVSRVGKRSCCDKAGMGTKASLVVEGGTGACLGCGG